MLVRITLASALLILGTSLLTLRSLGVQDFKKLTDRITNISTSFDSILRRVWAKVSAPLVTLGVFVGLSWPAIWIAISVFTGVELPGTRYFFLYLRRLIEAWPPSNAWEWALVLGTSETILIFAALLLFGLLYLAIRFAETGYFKKNKAVAMVALIMLSPLLISLALYVIVSLGAGILLLILLAALGVACSYLALLLVLAPMKLTSLVAERLAKHNVERLAVITGMLFLLISALLFAGIF